MANRLTKGTALAGRFSQDTPGYPKMGPAFTITNPGSTAEIDSGFKFSNADVLQGFAVRVQAVTATSGLLSFGLLTSQTSGFVIGMPVGTTGFKTPVVVSTSGDAPNAFYTANYLGPLLGGTYAGTTEGSTGKATAAGVSVQKLYALDTTSNLSLSYAYSSTANFTAVVFPIYYTLST